MKGCRPLTPIEYHLAANAFAGPNQLRDRALFIFGCKLGFRISELLSLRVRDVLHNNQVVSYVTVRRCNTKGKHSGRTQILNGEAKQAIQIYLAARRVYMPSDALFLSLKGGAITRIQAYRVLLRVYTRLQLEGKLGTHSMRKTFADGVYERLDKDLVKVKAALGHSNINSTISYLSFRQKDIDDAILDL